MLSVNGYKTRDSAGQLHGQYSLVFPSELPAKKLTPFQKEYDESKNMMKVRI